MAAHAIRAGEGDIFISGGVECVSQYTSWAGAGGSAGDDQNPLFADAQARAAEMAKSNDTWHDPREDGLIPDVYLAMGQTAENVATSRGVSRARQDEWGVTSQNRAEKAIADGFFAREISPVTLPDGSLASTDDGPRAGVTLEAVSGLNPVFRENGTITAGNCCPLNDGAAAVVVMSDTKAGELGLTPIARVVSTGVTGLSPEIMGLGPVGASRQALARAGMSIGDMDLYEINEAFAAQVLPSADDLGMDLDKLNVNGGAIALGHPFGSTGARITTTLLQLRSRSATCSSAWRRCASAAARAWPSSTNASPDGRPDGGHAQAAPWSGLCMTQPGQRSRRRPVSRARASSARPSEQASYAVTTSWSITTAGPRSGGADVPPDNEASAPTTVTTRGIRTDAWSTGSCCHRRTRRESSSATAGGTGDVGTVSCASGPGGAASPGRARRP